MTARLFQKDILRAQLNSLHQEEALFLVVQSYHYEALLQLHKWIISKAMSTKREVQSGPIYFLRQKKHKVLNNRLTVPRFWLTTFAKWALTWNTQTHLFTDKVSSSIKLTVVNHILAIPRSQWLQHPSKELEIWARISLRNPLSKDYFSSVQTFSCHKRRARETFKNVSNDLLRRKQIVWDNST